MAECFWWPISSEKAVAHIIGDTSATKIGGEVEAEHYTALCGEKVSSNSYRNDWLPRFGRLQEAKDIGIPLCQECLACLQVDFD